LLVLRAGALFVDHYLESLRDYLAHRDLSAWVPLFIDLVEEFGQRGFRLLLVVNRLLEVPLTASERVSAGIHPNP
jgi:hypothetical protein